MAGYEDDALQIQITVFEEHQVTDENKMPPMSHQELLDKLRLKVMHSKNHLLLLFVRYTELIINIVSFEYSRYRTRCTIRTCKIFYCKCPKWITTILKCEYTTNLIM